MMGRVPSLIKQLHQLLMNPIRSVPLDISGEMDLREGIPSHGITYLR